MNRSLVSIGIGSGAIIVGTTIMLLDPSHPLAGGIIALLGLPICWWSYTQVLADDRKELDWQNELLSEMKASNKSISAMVEEMRQERLRKPK